MLRPRLSFPRISHKPNQKTPHPPFRIREIVPLPPLGKANLHGDMKHRQHVRLREVRRTKFAPTDGWFSQTKPQRGGRSHGIVVPMVLQHGFAMPPLQIPSNRKEADIAVGLLLILT